MNTTPTITNAASQVQQSLKADYYQMEGWEVSSDDVSGSGNLNYQEIEVKIDKDLSLSGGEVESDYDADPAISRIRGIEEASYISQGDAGDLRELSSQGPSFIPSAESSSLSQLQSELQPLGIEKIADVTPDNIEFTPNANGNNGGGGSGGGSSVTLNNSERDTSTSTTTTSNTTTIDGCGEKICCDGDVTITINNTTISNNYVGSELINIDIVVDDTTIINEGDSILNLDLGDTINNITTIDFGGGGISLSIDNSLTIIGGDINTFVDLGLGDGGLNVDISLGADNLPIIGDGLEEITGVSIISTGDEITTNVQLIGGDALDTLIVLGENGLDVGLDIGVPPLIGGGLDIIDIDVNLGDGLGVNLDIIDMDIIDANILNGDVLDIDVLGQDLINDDLLGDIPGVDVLENDVVDIVADAAEEFAQGDLGGAIDGAIDGAVGGDLLDVELGGDALLEVDALGADVLGDGGLLADVVGEDAPLSELTPQEIVDVNVLADGEALGVDVLENDVVDIVADAAEELAQGDLGGAIDGAIDGAVDDLAGGDLLDVELGGDALLEVDALGADVLG
ncbi:MAG: hypothetical protein MK052_12135, partial [Alphaproteobacteria bacterium]|nr:hypothetical protein [Alphaproteobacteria bacterium]